MKKLFSPRQSLETRIRHRSMEPRKGEKEMLANAKKMDPMEEVFSFFVVPKSFTELSGFSLMLVPTCDDAFHADVVIILSGHHVFHKKYVLNDLHTNIVYALDLEEQCPALKPEACIGVSIESTSPKNPPINVAFGELKFRRPFIMGCQTEWGRIRFFPRKEGQDG